MGEMEAALMGVVGVVSKVVVRAGVEEGVGVAEVGAGRMEEFEVGIGVKAESVTGVEEELEVKVVIEVVEVVVGLYTESFDTMLLSTIGVEVLRGVIAEVNAFVADRVLAVDMVTGKEVRELSNSTWYSLYLHAHSIKL